MKKNSKYVNRIKSDAFYRILLELCLGTLLFNVNTYLGLFLFGIVFFEIIISKKIENCLFIFIFTAFNDEILIVNKLNGSISRLLMIAIVLKLVIYIIKNKIKPTKIHIGIMAFFVASCFVDISSFKENVIIIFNFLIFVLFSMTLNFSKKDLDKFLYRLFVVIIVSVCCSILYGVFTLNFLEYNQGDKIIYRFNGSYEPNFMCLYINLAILSLLAIKDKIKKGLFYTLCPILIVFSILTISITGLGTLFFSIILYFILFRKQWKVLLKDLMIVAIISGMLFGSLKGIKYEQIISNNKFIENKIENKDYNDKDYDKKSEDINDYIIIEEKKDSILSEKYSDNAILDRILRNYYLLKNGNIDEFTSGRSALIKDFVNKSFSRGIFSILFGNNPTNKKVYSSFFGHDCYSHNSYLDFLYNFGIIGFIVIVYFMFYKVAKNLFLGLDLKNSLYCKNIKLIRIMLIIFIFTLSMYTHRVLLLFFVL